MNLYEITRELSELQNAVIAEAKCKCICALMLSEDISFGEASKKLEVPYEETEALRDLLKAWIAED